MLTSAEIDQEKLPPRFIVGIDLGTTNSAVGFIDTAAEEWRVQTLAVPQFVDAGQVEALETLPSFHYQPTAAEALDGSLRLPWQKHAADHVVGVFARDQGGRVPGRLIASAKSWLCHSGVDRTAELLPWHGAADVQRLSPVAASARYLRHLADAWNHSFRDFPLAEQEIVLTLPASFDEVARELTVAAAAQAGLPRVVLIEEPQAAFYAWIDVHRDDWQTRVEPGQKILVCDIGGGTTDFTLIRVRRGDDGLVQFHRVAVGDHLILGGDNMDLALARHLEQRLGGGLVANAWDTLVRQCRRVKEDLLGGETGPTMTFNLPGTGSRLIGGGQRVEVPCEECRRLLLDGFFPQVALEDKPRREQSGFREFGLPYASDAAVTRYLAAFLTAHRFAGEASGEMKKPSPPASLTTVAGRGEKDADPARPDIVLFNGGVFESPFIRERVLAVLQSWFGAPPRVLDHVRLDLAVAHGAAYYGAVRRGRGVRIAAGLARAYYIGVSGAAGEPLQAVCLVPGDAQPGQDIALSQRRFDLLVHQPVEFPLYVSSVRLTDRPGDVVAVDAEQMKSLPPIRTALKTSGKKQAGSISVELHSRLTEIGTLELWCAEAGRDRRWRLQFDVRSATQTDLAAAQTVGESQGVLEESAWQYCAAAIAETFSLAGTDKPEQLVKRLAEILAADRSEWPMTLLRRIWESLIEHESGRKKSPTHEARWLNLLGFSLRPGYGLAVDDWRVAETWRAVQGKLAFGAVTSRTESWILWRRIAGGCTAGQQRALADPLLAMARGFQRRAAGAKSGVDPGISPPQTSEMWRLLGSLELLDLRTKLALGDLLVEMLDKKSMQPARAAIAWSLGRVGSRSPVYGPLNTVVPAESAAEWLAALMRTRQATDAEMLAAMQLARRTDDRFRDLPAAMRDEVASWLDHHHSPRHWIDLVRSGGQLDVEEQTRIFGESLPVGLRIV